MKRLYVCHATPDPWRRTDAKPSVKLGVSVNPARRKWGLRRPGCDSPKLVWQSAMLPDAYKIEFAIKRRLAHRCVAETEWFDLAPSTVIKVAREEIRRHARH